MHADAHTHALPKDPYFGFGSIFLLASRPCLLFLVGFGGIVDVKGGQKKDGREDFG